MNVIYRNLAAWFKFTKAKTKTIRKDHGCKPSVESLEDRLAPAAYWWRPIPALVVNVDQYLCSTVLNQQTNWTDGPGVNAVRYQQAPGPNDVLRFDGGPIRDCIIDPAASSTFAAIRTE